MNPLAFYQKGVQRRLLPLGRGREVGMPAQLQKSNDLSHACPHG